MKTTLASQFDHILGHLRHRLSVAPAVPVKSWQSTQAPQPMPEVLNYSFTLDLDGADLGTVKAAIAPNLPWADNHFIQERVSGHPLNPGTTWRQWPYALSADKHRRGDGEEDPQFDHSYAERYWPKFAGGTEGGRLKFKALDGEPIEGIRFPYGDLSDLVHLLHDDPYTRQAYLPVWFPEDLAAARLPKRVPCTLGYHFIMRDDRLHCVYPMRSCDFIRHFQDDVYLTIRLQMWVLDILRFKDPSTWEKVKTGTFTMHITSLHLFKTDQDALRRQMGKAPL